MLRIVRSIGTAAGAAGSGAGAAGAAGAGAVAGLYREPAKWKGLKPETVISLYWERVAKMGKEYKQSPEELEALLGTSEYTGVPEAHIRKLYKYGEKGAMEIGAGAGPGAGAKARDVVGGFSRFQFDELPSQALDLVDQHREQRFYNRLAAYELPLLAKYRQEYKPPSASDVVTYKYFTYVGEEHPNSRKVVLSLKTESLGLEPRALHKFRVLARTRYDHETDLFKMSSDKFPEAQQNAKYLGDILKRLLQEAKDLSKDDFSDIPLDTRHTIAKNLRKKHSRRLKTIEFPEEWKRPEDAPVKKVNITEELMKLL